MRMLEPIDRLHGALTDPAGAERNVVLALAVYAVLWTLYGTIAKSGQGLHPDMTELLDWSRHLAWGYKHPPLAAALVWLWFKVFPVAAWSYYLLAMLMPAVTLWIVWRLSADYLDIEKRRVRPRAAHAGAVLQFPCAEVQREHRADAAVGGGDVLVPARLYDAQRALCRTRRRRRRRLHAGQILVDLPDRRARRRRADRQTPRAFISARRRPGSPSLAGAIVLAPHLVWLYQHDFAPFAYAVGIHGDKPFSETVVAALGYLAGSAGYVAVPVIIALVGGAPQPRRARRYGVARRSRPPAGGGGILGAAAAAGRGRAGQRHRHHLAVVDVGLDAVAGAAAVAEGDDDLEPWTRAACSPSRWRCRWSW